MRKILKSILSGSNNMTDYTWIILKTMKIIIGFANQIIYIMANVMLSQSGQKKKFIQIHANNDESVCASQSAEPNLILLNILTE